MLEYLVARVFGSVGSFSLLALWPCFLVILPRNECGFERQWHDMVRLAKDILADFTLEIRQ